MGCVIDHLQSDYRVEVIRSFVDARGIPHQLGEVAIIRAMNLDWASQEIVLDWERDGVPEKIFLLLGAKDGPRNGRMRDYFSVREYAPRPREKRKVEVPALPADNTPVTDPARYEDAATRLWALAARSRFDEAEEQIRLILAPDDPYDGRLERLAGDLVAMAVLHAEDPDEGVYAWARQRGISLWYAWGSGATSGGEGAVRGDRIRDVEARLAECDARRR